MKRSIIFYILLFLLFLPAAAQKKEINAARDNVKAGKNLDKAEQSMMTLLKDSDNRDNKKIWTVLFGSLQKQYAQGNEKLYLKQKYDTASLFNIASRMFTVMEAYDSIDALPDKKGRVRPEKRKDNAKLLNTIRPNLYNGGIYYIKKQNYNQAYKLLDQYISAADLPMFKSYNYTEKDKYLPSAAYWAVYCGYKLKDANKVLHNTYLALKDVARQESMLQYLSATYKLEKDTTRWIETLTDGINKYPKSDYFFPHLIEYYSGKNDWDAALSITNKTLKADSTNRKVWLTKSTILLNTGDFEKSYEIADSLVKLDTIAVKGKSDIAEAWLNAGLALFNQGVALDKNVQTIRRNRRKILEYYRKALPYIETYRKLMPKNKDKWALPLYTIYLNLNMGKQFDEIDHLLRK